MAETGRGEGTNISQQLQKKSLFLHCHCQPTSNGAVSRAERLAFSMCQFGVAVRDGIILEQLIINIYIINYVGFVAGTQI